MLPHYGVRPGVFPGRWAFSLASSLAGSVFAVVDCESRSPPGRMRFCGRHPDSTWLSRIFPCTCYLVPTPFAGRRVRSAVTRSISGVRVDRRRVCSGRRSLQRRESIGRHNDGLAAMSAESVIAARAARIGGGPSQRAINLRSGQRTPKGSGAPSLRFDSGRVQFSGKLIASFGPLHSCR